MYVYVHVECAELNLLCLSSSVELFIRNKYEKKLYIAKDTPTTARAPQVKREPERERVKAKKQQPPTQRKEQVRGSVCVM